MTFARPWLLLLLIGLVVWWWRRRRGEVPAAAYSDVSIPAAVARAAGGSRFRPCCAG